MLALLKRVNPAFGRELDIEHGAREHPRSSIEIPDVKRFHFHMQEGMVVVGLKLIEQGREGRVTSVESCNYGACVFISTLQDDNDEDAYGS